MKDTALTTCTSLLGLVFAFFVAIFAIFTAGVLWAVETTPPPIIVPTHSWEVGPGLAALVIAIVTSILTTVTVVVNAILGSAARKNQELALSEVKKVGQEAKTTGDLTHTIVNSQRTEMTAELKAQREEMAALKAQIRELTASRDIARDTAKATEVKKDV
jgi:hypothetical protein